MESCTCVAPEELLAAGPKSLRLLRELVAGLPSAHELSAPFAQLAARYEATLYAALDFHGLCDLHEHDVQARRTAALLQASLPPLRAALVGVSFADDAAFAAAAQDCRRAVLKTARLCAVEVSSPPEPPTHQGWSSDVARFLALRHERQRRERQRGAAAVGER
jgi:hypothetical protein